MKKFKYLSPRAEEEYAKKLDNWQNWANLTSEKYNVSILTNKKKNSFYFVLNGINYRVSTHQLPNKYYDPTDPNSKPYRTFNGFDGETIEIIVSTRKEIKEKIITLLKNSV